MKSTRYWLGAGRRQQNVRYVVVTSITVCLLLLIALIVDFLIFSGSIVVEFATPNRFSKSYASSPTSSSGGYGIERASSPMQGVTTVYDSNGSQEGGLSGSGAVSGGTARGGSGRGDDHSTATTAAATAVDNLSGLRPQRAQRRRMVADCKALRFQVYDNTDTMSRQYITNSC
jgi:hypothetical protein